MEGTEHCTRSKLAMSAWAAKLLTNVQGDSLEIISFKVNENLLFS